jgi:5-(carboxyamino)imidazole ribonucleotide mutase
MESLWFLPALEILITKIIGINMQKKLVGIIMGSKSDWPIVEHAAQTLEKFKIPYEAKVMSAHRTPDAVAEYAKTAEERGLEIIIAAAGGAAHLAGVIASHTIIPVLGIPMESKLIGLDSLLATSQMPAGIPVATFAIGKPGAINAALFAIAILSGKYPEYNTALHEFRRQQTAEILAGQHLI